jgi:predicted nuclease of predicted toxin-antitoxin system
LNFFLDENVPISIKDVIHDLGFNVFTLHDFNKLGVQNGEVAKLALKEKAIIITLDSDFLARFERII